MSKGLTALSVLHLSILDGPCMCLLTWTDARYGAPAEEQLPHAQKFDDLLVSQMEKLKMP